jgi:hypothetical protein
MYFIDESFFIGDIYIPNVGEYCDNMNFDIKIFISKYESEALINTLGGCLFNELKQQLEYSEDKKRFVLKSDAETKWDWLLNGYQYTQQYQCGCTCNCDKRIWNGIISSTPILTKDGIKKVKQSYLAYWIYYQRMFYKNSHSTGTGESVNQTENAVMISNETKRKYAFNRFVELVEIGNGNEVSLYRFLNDHHIFFPEWCPTQYEPLTYFDI